MKTYNKKEFPVAFNKCNNFVYLINVIDMLELNFGKSNMIILVNHYPEIVVDFWPLKSVFLFQSLSCPRIRPVGYMAEAYSIWVWSWE